MTASCIELYHKGILQQREEIAYQMLSCCVLCPRRCKVNRLAGETGVCGTGSLARIASFGPHFGEEQPLVGSHGSGTIFLSSCSLGCGFCQNYDISHHPNLGEEASTRGFADLILELQQKGCHNINLVTPSHVVPQIISALVLAVEGGLKIPVVYNTSGYDSTQSLELLDGIIDIYMPDFKFWNPKSAALYADAEDYPERARTGLRIMHRQVGDLQLDDSGIAVTGLLVRHLLMPDAMEETERILTFIANSISRNTYINIMDQYHPCGNAHRFRKLDRSIRPAEFEKALVFARHTGLTRIDKLDITGILSLLHKI